MPEKRIALCMAAFKGCEPEIVHMHMLLASRLSREPGWKYHPFVVGRKSMALACNTTLENMEELERSTGETFTHVLWMDDDVGILAEDAVRLINCIDDEHPAVYALAFFRQPPYKPSLWRQRRLGEERTTFEQMFDYPADTLVRVDAAGLCAAAFDRRLFNMLKKPYFRLVEKGYKQTACTPDGALCNALGDAKVPIYVHTGIKTTHMSFPQRVTEEFALKYKDQWGDP